MGSHSRHPWPSGQPKNLGGKTVCYPSSFNMFSVSVKMSFFFAHFCLAPELKDTHTPCGIWPGGEITRSVNRLFGEGQVVSLLLLLLLLLIQILLSLFSASFHLFICMYLDWTLFWQIFPLFSSHPFLIGMHRDDEPDEFST